MNEIYVEIEEECTAIFLRTYKVLVPDDKFSEFVEKISIPEDFKSTINDYNYQEIDEDIIEVGKAHEGCRRILEIYTD